MDTASVHLLVELHGCSSDLLDDTDHLTRLMESAALVAGARIVNTASHRFVPQGVSLLVVIEESHFSIHTWPEVGYAAVDFFTCGTCRPEEAVRVLASGLCAARTETMRVLRGHRDTVPSAHVAELHTTYVAST